MSLVKILSFNEDGEVVLIFCLQLQVVHVRKVIDAVAYPQFEVGVLVVH